MEYAVAIILGLTGSFHCLGMCGPLLLATPFKKQDEKSLLVWYPVLYHIGRILSYAILGVLLGMVGGSFKLVGLQQYFTIGIALIMLMYVLDTYIFKTRVIFKFLHLPSFKMNPWIKRAFTIKNFALSRFTLGILNGFLPCGLVFMAMGGALVQKNWMFSLLFMVLFGIGTTPLLLALIFSKNFIAQKYMPTIHKLIPYVSLLIAVLFLLRGLNLGIPYLSPKFSENIQKVKCH